MKQIGVFFLCLVSFFLSAPVYASDLWNVKVVTENGGTKFTNEQLDAINWDEFFAVNQWGEKGLKMFLLNISRDLKIIVYTIVLLWGLIMVIKLIFGSDTEEQQKKIKTGLLWSSIGLVVMQTALSAQKIFFDQDVGSDLARRFANGLVEPFMNLLLFLASFMFIVTAIIAFYKMITANGHDDHVTEAKQSIIQAILWFIVIKFAGIMVNNTYNPDCGSGSIVFFWGSRVCNQITQNAKIFSSIINWVNTFVVLAVILMLIYAWFLVLTSGWDDDKQKKAKNIILYVAIGMAILVVNYLLFTFFIKP